MKFQRLIIIEAEEFTGASEQIKKFKLHKFKGDDFWKNWGMESHGRPYVVSIGDWIATDEYGKCYPLKKDELVEKYDQVGDVI